MAVSIQSSDPITASALPSTDNSARENANKASIILLCVLTLLIYVGSAFSPSLQDDADAAHAEAAREMVERDNYVTLHINGIRYLEKAPFLYWCVASSYKIFGFTEFATRLPQAIFTLLLVLAVYWFGMWMGGERAGLYSGLATSVGLGIYLFTRTMIPEVIIAFFITASCYFFLKAYLGELSTRWYYAFYVGMALAVLAKGLIGIVFPLGTLFLFVLVTGGLRRIPEMRPVTGILLFLAIAVPWHALATMRTEKFFWFYFINEHFLRYLGKRYPVDYDYVPIVPFWLLHFVWLFPFSIFLPLALRRARALVKSEDVREKLRLFAWLWVFVVIGFFSFSTRQEYYTFPCFPALALLSGTALAVAERDQLRYLKIAHGMLALAGIAVAAVLGYMLWLSRDIPAPSDISQLLTQNPENYKLALGHMSDLTASAFAALRVPAAGAGLVLSIGFVTALVLRLRKQALAATIAMALTVGGFIYFAHMALEVFDPYLSSKALAMEVKKRLAPGDIVVINGEYQGGSSIGFYLPQKVLLLNGRMTGLEFGSYYPDAPPVFIDYAEITRLWQGDKRVFIFVYADKFAELKQHLPGELHLIAGTSEKAIYSNRP